MARTLKKRVPVDIGRFKTVVYKKGFKSIPALSREMGRSDSYLDGQAKKEGFSESTVISLERMFGIKPEDYQLEIPIEKGIENDDKNEVVAYAREITRLSNLIRTLKDEIRSDIEEDTRIINKNLRSIMKEFGLENADKTQFEIFEEVEYGLPIIDTSKKIYRYQCAPCDFWSGGIIATEEERKIIYNLMPKSEGIRGDGVYKAYLPGNGCNLEAFYFCKADNNGTTFIFSNSNLTELHWEEV